MILLTEQLNGPISLTNRWKNGNYLVKTGMVLGGLGTLALPFVLGAAAGQTINHPMDTLKSVGSGLGSIAKNTGSLLYKGLEIAAPSVTSRINTLRSDWARSFGQNNQTPTEKPIDTQDT